MKIIGKNKDNYIVEINAQELAKAAGWRSDYETKFKQAVEQFIDKGTATFNLGSAYDEAADLLAVYENIKTAATTLKNASTRILNHIDKNTQED